MVSYLRGGCKGKGVVMGPYRAPSSGREELEGATSMMGEPAARPLRAARRAGRKEAFMVVCLEFRVFEAL
jgi:hypothetical protein